MKISIPEKIKSDVEIIESVWLETANANAGDQNSPAFAGSMISLKHVAAVDFVNLHNDVFENCAKIQYRVLYKNNTTEIFKFNGKQQAVYRSKMSIAAQQCVRHKTSELFEDTDTGRQQCLDVLAEKTVDVCMQSKETQGTKNLIYYTIYFNKGYIELLNKSVTSVLEQTKMEFDLLLISDQATKEIIMQQPFVEKIQPKFLLTQTPFDGIEASQNKTRVFEYDNINEYDKILFLDCDIVCLKDVKTIFDNELKHDVLYTARNTNLAYWHHKTFHHGFEFLGDEHVREMTLAQQMPFNAGQFLFRNSDRMRAHFDNVNWFMKNWAGEYFFEQAFIGYYFCKAYMTDDTVLQKHMSIISTTNTTEYNITNDTCLVHFIAPPLDANTKLKFIDKFVEEHSKEINWISKCFIKLKTFFKRLFKHHEQPYSAKI